MASQTGTISLAIAETTGSVTFPLSFVALPVINSPGIQNTSADNPKLTLFCLITGITLSGFTYQLSAPPDTANYKLSYQAEGPVDLPATSSTPASTPDAVSCSSCYITEQEVREYVEDYDTAHGMLGQVDYDFAPKAILSAMQACAREYNGLPPRISNVRPTALPKNSNLFFDGIAYFLYLRALQHEKRHDVPYKAGSVEVDIAARRIAHYEGAIKMFNERFFGVAKQHKRLANYTLMSGRVG